jgi:hypothetical protein
VTRVISFLPAFLARDSAFSASGEESSFAFWGELLPHGSKVHVRVAGFRKKTVALYFEIGAEDGTKHTLNI